jgi:tetraacyldisaccharide 4'-kinase
MNQPSSLRRLLLPLVPLYQLALAFRELRLRPGLEPVQRLCYPVVSIGNLSTGGSGKTPLTIALAKALTALGLHVDVLSRGYGRRSKLAARVNPEGTAEDFGDEPLLIAREAGVPVYVAPRRYDAGLLAEAAQSLAGKEASQVGQGLIDCCISNLPVAAQEAHCSLAPRFSVGKADFARELKSPVGTVQDISFAGSNSPGIEPEESTRALAPEVCIHLLDDGFQHRQLARDVDILLLNSQDWQDRLLPAGNLREPLKAARRASVIAIPVDDPELEADLRAWGWQKPIWRLRRRMEIPAVNGPVAAFCGIARPEQFFAGLQATGLRLVSRTAFPDHHRYATADLNRLVVAARAAGATALVTTGKDLVRLGKLASFLPEFMPLMTAWLRVEIEDQAAALDWLVNRLAPGSTHPPL